MGRILRAVMMVASVFMLEQFVLLCGIDRTQCNSMDRRTQENKGKSYAVGLMSGRVMEGLSSRR